MQDRMITRDIDGVKHEPFEHLVIDVSEQHSSSVIGVRASSAMSKRLTYLHPYTAFQMCADHRI